MDEYPSTSTELMIFTDMTLRCGGQIDKWQIHASNTGTVNVGVWRPTGQGTYRLIGVNTLTVEETGTQVSQTFYSLLPDFET